MMAVQISTHFGIVIRRSSLDDRGVTLDQVLKAMETAPLGESDELLSFGPHFGGEAAEEFSRRLEDLGLSFIDDFFVFDGDIPPWCRLIAALDQGE